MRPWIVFSSSSGETFARIWESLGPDARKNLRGFYTDRECPALGVASKLLSLHQPVQMYPKSDFESAVLAELGALPHDAVIWLIGFFGILSKDFLEKVGRPIFNTHPSLLPSFPGLEKKVHQAVYDQALYSGFSVHLVTEHLDGGPLVAQFPVWVGDCTSSDDLRARVRKTEQNELPNVIESTLKSTISANDRNLSTRQLRQKESLT